MKKILILFGAVLLLVLGCDLALVKPEKEPETEESENAFEEIDTLIRAGKTKEALNLLEKEDKESAAYFSLKEIAYIEDGSEEANEALSELYKEAADLYPEWQHMQKMAGVAALYEGNYQSAGYRLFEALRLNEEDAECWYYLGALSYCEGNYEDMRQYFEQALARDLSEKICF